MTTDVRSASDRSAPDRTGPDLSVQRAASAGPVGIDRIVELLGEAAPDLLEHQPAVSRELLALPGPDFIDRVYARTDRSPQVLRSLGQLFGHGRLGGTGYLSILPVDQGIEHSAGASFSVNPRYFDPEGILELAVEGGCNAVASTFGVLGAVSRSYAHRIPFICKVNHAELLTFPNEHKQRLYGTVREAWNLGAAAVGATVYFGSDDAGRELTEVAELFAHAHELGMATVLWCYLRNPGFSIDGTNHETSADLTAQANHLGATVQADIIKQKLPTQNGGFPAVKARSGQSYGKTDKRMYGQLTTDHPIDLCRWQVLNNLAGRAGLINSGGASSGGGDLAAVVRTAVVNKRAGGTGLITGRKAFQRPMAEGVALLHAVQDVYLCPEVTVA
ncbi:MAG TPA: class I fructose-bisphosphate aldolase [Motilibacteraceae bacterium]|nr:class I fructose-bisphosphate aldolase [Motilibacteraceae bacterium]